MTKGRKTLLIGLFLIISFLVSFYTFNNNQSLALIEDIEKKVSLDNLSLPVRQWITPGVISTESTGNSYFQDIASDTSGNLHVVWRDQTNYDSSGADWDIFYKKWNATTETWSVTEVVTTESPGNSHYPDVEVDSIGNVHVVWDDSNSYGGSGGDQDIYYKQWFVSNSSWGDSLVVSTESSSASNEPSFCIDSSDNAHIVWADATNYDLSGTDVDIFYKKWVASTESFTTTEVVSTISSAISRLPDISADNDGNLHIAWSDESFRTDDDILYRRWNNSIALWSSTELLTFGTDFENHRVDIQVDNHGNVHVIWDAEGTGANSYVENIFYRMLSYESLEWSSTESVVSDLSSSEVIGFPDLAVDNTGNIFVVWDQAFSGYDNNIKFRFFNSYTSTWSPEHIVSIAESLLEVNYPSMIADNLGQIHLTWSDITDYLSSGTDQDILYRKLSVTSEAPILETPELAIIIPNPSEVNNIYLDWNDIDGATEYYIFRATSYIWSTFALMPIGTTASSFYMDTLPADDFYFYVIVATDGTQNSTISNCEYVHFELPSLNEFTVITSLIVGVALVTYIFTKINKRRN